MMEADVEDPQAEELAKQFSNVKKLKQSYVTQGSALGFDKNMLDSMSARELQGFVDGLKMRAALSRSAELIQRQRSEEETAAGLEGFARRYGELLGKKGAPSVEQLQDYYENGTGNDARPEGQVMDPKAALAQALRENPRAARSPHLDNLLSALQRGRDYLPLGKTVEVPGQGVMIGTGTGQPHFAAAASVEDASFLTDPVSGKRFLQQGKSVLPSGEDPAIAKPKKQASGNYPWLLVDDPKEFMKGLKTISDPEERDRVLSTRVKVNQAAGKTDFNMALLEMMGVKPKEAGKSKNEEGRFKKGQRAIQGGHTFEYDGKEWKAVR